MRTAIISDIHGNLPALLRVLEDAQSSGVDQFVFVGDYIFDLKFSNDVTRVLMEMESAHIIKGNKESYLRTLSAENQETWTSAQYGCVYQTFRELTPEVYGFLDSLDEELRIELLPGVSLYAVHYLKRFRPSPKNNCGSSNFHKKMLMEPFSHEDYLSDFSGIMNSCECRPHIDRINADVIVFGHNHLQSHCICGDKLIVNPGSCGQPLDFDPAAAYTILEGTVSGLTVTEKRVEYDVESTISRARDSKLYEQGKIWSELVFLALRTGRDYFGIFFEIAGQIAAAKGESGTPFSNATWAAAYEVFAEKYM